jgi:tetratricopeptide (TPR) repeat protein
MPTGSFVILLPTESDYKILGYYFKEGTSGFEISNDLFLRLNLDHSKNEFNLLKIKDLQIFSYIHKFKGKLSRNASGIIIGLLLNEDDKPNKFRSPLKETAEAFEIPSLNILKKSKEQFEAILKDVYLEHLEPLIDILQPDALKNSIINITKLMLSGGKKERKIAQDLLQKVENGEHNKISEHYNTAESAMKSLEYEKAAKFYNKAAEIAENLYIMDIAASLKEKGNFSQQIPDLSKERERIVQEGRNALRNEDFHTAYTYYKRASEISKKLIQFDKEEEYRLKAKALEDFYKIDEKYKKNK